MAPMKNKKKINDECESSAAANKRMRMDILNATNGVPFTSRFTQFPSIHMLHPQRNPPPNTAIGTDLRLAPPSPVQPQELAADDAFISTLIPQQNFIINYHMNQMIQSVEEFWRRTVAGELRKRKEMERMLKDKEEQVERFRQMYNFYEERAFVLENMRVTGEGSSRSAVDAGQEDVQSCYVDVRSAQRMEIKCRNCLNRPASMVWLPCRHLSVCMVCERRVKNCPICSVKKTQSFHINMP